MEKYEMNIRTSCGVCRFLCKRTTIPGEVATIPPSEDHTDGYSDTKKPKWKPTDVYMYEFFYNIPDEKMYFRNEDGIIELEIK